VLATSGSRAKLIIIAAEQLFEPEGLIDQNPLVDLAKHGGRDAVRHLPMAGCALYNATASHLANGKPAGGDPDGQHRGDAAIAHDRHVAALERGGRARASRDLITAELRGREALLYSPGEPNHFAIVIDALRRTDRHAEALKLLPRAKKAMPKPPPDAQTDGDRACLLDCMLLLAQLGKRDEAEALAAKFPRRIDKRIHAVLAIISRTIRFGRSCRRPAISGHSYALDTRFDNCIIDFHEDGIFEDVELAGDGPLDHARPTLVAWAGELVAQLVATITELDMPLANVTRGVKQPIDSMTIARRSRATTAGRASRVA